MGIEDLKRMICQYHRSRDEYRNSRSYNEQACRDEFISPMLECFGWDVQNKRGVLPQYKEVVVEKFSNNLERPDYTLTLNGISKIFVEAKKPSIDITIEIEPALQIRRYGWNAKHKIAVLTNFENLLIYDTTNKPDKSQEATTSLYRKYHYTEYIEKYNEINDLISRDSIYSGRYDLFVESNFQEKNRYHAEIDDMFLAQINLWRLELGRYLYEVDDRYKNIDLLNDVVQEFINQIIFLRICEDRNLPLYKKLKDAIKDKIELKDTLTRVFKEADKRYNSGLFKGKYIIFDLNNEIIFNMVMSLYYPQTPYLFNIIEPSILGKVYEAFLAERLIDEKKQIQLARREEYKYRSVVTTPIEIVKYMIKNTLEPLCKGKRPEELLNLKIADIACGSGIFLEEAYQYIVNYCTEWYSLHQPDYLLKLSNGKKKLPLSDKRKILTGCIFGIDINIHAVEVAKFSLLLKLIEDETEPSVISCNPILPDLSVNICHGNSLISDEDLKSYDVSTETLIDIVPFNWQCINNGNKFDAIIGNPPYVKTEDMHDLLHDVEFCIYKKNYRSAYKQFDQYFLFVERALSKINTEGRVCFIIPNKFYKIAAGQELRKLVAKKTAEIDDFGDLQLFPDKTIYSSIVTFIYNNNDELKYMNIKSITSLWAGDDQDQVTLKTNILGQDPWRLSTDISFIKMINKMEDISVPLSKVVNVFNGIQTSAERPEPIYWFDKSNIISEEQEIYRIHKFGKEYLIEKSILKPYFKPTKLDEKGMNTYSLLTTDKLIIFPYDYDGNLINIEIMRTIYPGTFSYLSDCYDYLVPRSLNNGVGRDVQNATYNTWYQYGRTQALTAFINTPKLIVRILSKEPMYAFDNNNMLIASGGTAGYCAISKLPNSKYELEYIQAWLAHPYTEKLLKTMGSDFENGFTARGTFLLSKLPFVELDFTDKIQKSIYDTVIEITRMIYKINEDMQVKVDKASLNILEKEKNKLIKQIEDNITMIYQQNFR